MNEQLIILDNSKFTTLIVDPTIAYKEDRKWHCPTCKDHLFSLNRKFAVIADGVSPFSGMNMEVPTSVFRMTKMCYKCQHYYIIYFDSQGVK